MKKLKKRLISWVLVITMMLGLMPTTVFAANEEKNYKSEYGITVMVGETEMDLVADGTETCGIMQAQKLNVTVPAGTTEVTFLNITDEVLWGQMYVYSGAHDWTEYASNVTEATISLTECGTSFCVSDSANAWYHVNITVAEEEEPVVPELTDVKLIVSDSLTVGEDGVTYTGFEKGQRYTFSYETVPSDLETSASWKLVDSNNNTFNWTKNEISYTYSGECSLTLIVTCGEKTIEKTYYLKGAAAEEEPVVPELTDVKLIVSDSLTVGEDGVTYTGFEKGQRYTFSYETVPSDLETSASWKLVDSNDNTFNWTKNEISYTYSGECSLTLIVTCGEKTIEKTYYLKGAAEEVNKYTIDVRGSYGSVTADKEEAAEGETVILTATPDEGYEFGYFEVLETDNYEEVNIEFTELDNNQYSFVMPAYGLDITGCFKKGAASVDAAGFVIKVNDVELELVDGGTEACTYRYVSDLFRVVNVTVPTGTTTVTVEKKESETNTPNIQYMNGNEHTFGGNAMPAFEANVADYDGLCIKCGGNYYHVKITEQEKVGEYQSITTDMEGDVIVTEQDEMIAGWIPYYHVVVPRGSTYAYVTYPENTIYVYGGQAHVTEFDFSGGHCPDKFWKATENEDGSVTVALPIADLITDEPGTGVAPAFWKASGTEVLEGFTFSYAEDTTIWLVTLAAGNGYTTDGEGYVKTGEDYSFTVDIKNGYDATNMVVKVNGKEVTADENGIYTVEAVSEDLKITVEGVEVIPSDGDVTVYFTAEKGNQFIEQGGVVWALEEVTIPYFDLALYDMEYLYYNPDCYSEGQASQAPGTKEMADGVVTLLHMMIWMTEVYYNNLDPSDAGKGWLAENDWKGFSVYSATAGSAFFYIWNLGTDFNYYLNYEYPLGYPGWGATCDQIRLSDGDVVSLRYNDNSGKVGTYHHFGEKGLITKTVNKGQVFDLNLFSTGEDYANYTTPIFNVGEGHKVYLFEQPEMNANPATGTLMDTTDADGKVTIDTSDLNLGTYYLVSDSTSPAVMLLTIEGEEEPVVPELTDVKLIVSDSLTVGEDGVTYTGFEKGQRYTFSYETVPSDLETSASWKLVDSNNNTFNWTKNEISYTYSGECSLTLIVTCGEKTIEKTYYLKGAAEEEPSSVIAVTANGTTVEVADGGTEACGPVVTAQIYNVTVPAGTTTITVEPTSESDRLTIYKGCQTWNEVGNGKSIELTVSEGVNKFDVSDSAYKWYHLNVTVEEPEYQLGDVDMDGDIDTEDAGLAISYYYGSGELNDTQLKLADVDKDGDVDTEDAGLIVSYYYGSIKSFN